VAEAERSLQVAAEAVASFRLTVQDTDPPLLGKLDGELQVKQERQTALNDLDAFPALVERDVPARGTLSIRLFTSQKDVASAVVVNANHATIDGRSMRSFLELFLQALEGVQIDPLPRTSSPPVDWTVALQPPSTGEEDPKFLPIVASDPNAVPLTLYQALGLESIGAPGADVRIDLDQAAVKAALAACRNRTATATGLWTASLLRALAVAHYAKAPPDETKCVVSVSILVDVRESLDPSVTSPADIAQALATVTVGTCIAKSSLDAFDILSEAATVTKDMRLRIQRGEAHRQAMLLGGGNFEAGPPPATIELSNLGKVAVPDPSMSLHFSQRFDGYEGMSILLHSESESGTMRLIGSLGSGVPSEVASNLLSRARDLFLSAGQ